VKAFNPDRLGIARRRRGLKKAELADAIGVTRRAVSGYEAGENAPSDETVERLSRVLAVPREFFKLESPPQIRTEGASFRSLAAMTARQKHTVLAAGAIAIELSRLLEERLVLPKLDVPDLRHEQPEEAAAVLRRQWGLGEAPIANMVHLIEAHGIRVFSLLDECREVDAFSAWVDGRAFVFLNTGKSGERGRFDAAHELGHLVLHRHGARQGREAEKESDRFASALLMPRAALTAMAPRLPSLDRLLDIKRVWRVSLAAVARRLHDLGLLGRWQYEHICVELSRRGWRTSEPEGIDREVSQLLQKALVVLRDEGMTVRDLAGRLCISLTDLSMLAFGLVPACLPGGGGDVAGPKPDPGKLCLVK
jgi:Zn-dependent peptidase ImmA (M78 family)/DNA-binding XRE family transcriptional regulator